MAREIAHGEVVIGVDLDRVGAELAHAEAQFSRAMANIDRMKAEAKAELDTGPLKRDIAEAQAYLKTLRAKEIDLKLNDKSTANVKREIMEITSHLNKLQSKKTTLDIDPRALKEVNRELKISEQQQAATERQAIRTRKAFESEMMSAARLEMVARKQVETDRKRAVELETLRTKYIRLHDEIEKGQKLALFDFLGDETARRKFARTAAELKQVGGRLKELGDNDADLWRLAKASDSAGGRLRRMASSLGSVRLQMGFVSATLRQAVMGFTVLGPVIFGLLGQIVSLVGVLGTGLTGALAVTSAGLAGFGFTALGVGLIMKPLIGDLQDAKKASDAYGDAVRKYGKGSDQAATAQEKLNKTLGDVGPQTRQAFESLGSMSSRWSNLTSSSRPVFFEAMAAGIRAANRLMPMFAQESNRAFATAGREAKKWFSLFSSPEASSGIQQIMSNFTEAVPNISAGFRSLTVMMGRVSTSASTLLPELTTGFSEWSRNLMDSVGSGAGLDAGIARLVDHMRQLGRFAQSAGAMLATFFNAGANEGATLLNTLTNIFNRWNAWMSSASGQDSLASFFSEANAIGSQFVGTLAQLGVAMFEFSAAFAPLSQGAIYFVNAMTSVVAAVMSLAPARAIVTGLGGALAGAFVAGKLMTAAQAISTIVTAVRTLGAAGTVMSVASLTNPIIAVGAAVGVAVAAFSLLSSGASTAESALATLATASSRTKRAIDELAGIEATMAQSSLEAATAQAAETKAATAYQRAIDKYGASSKQARAAQEAYTRAIMASSDATQRYNQAQRDQQQNIRSNYAKANGEVLDLLKKQKTAQEELDDAIAGQDKGFINKKRDALADVNAALSEARAKADQYGDAVERAELNTMRAGERNANITQNIGEAWGRLSNIPFFSERFGSKIAKIVSPEQAASVVRLTDSLREMGKLGAAKNVLGDMTKFDPASVNATIAKLKQLRAEASKGGKAIVTATVKKGQAEKDLGSLGKGKTATIQTKADTKNAERSLKGLSGKQLAARLTIRANNSDAISKLNQVQRARLQTKLVKLGASPQAAVAAINMINGKKLEAKIAKFKAETGDAEAGDRKVQGFKDKTVTATTKWAGQSEMSAAQAAIAAIQSKTVTVTTNYQSNGSPGRAAGGPTAGAYVPMPAQEKRHAESANRAGTRQSQPGVYRRPTLLVGEENRREWVIAENPSYRGANERYLQDAAANFGYRLTPFDANAATGADFAKKRDGYVKKQSKKDKKGKPRAERHGGYSYDFIQSQINLLSDKSSNLETERTANLERNPGADPSKISPALSKVLGPLYQIKNKWYDELAYNLKVRSNQAARAATRSAKELRGKDGLNADFRAAKKRLQKIRGEKPQNEKERKSKDKRLRSAEQQFEKARTARDNARRKVNERGDSAGALWRELQQVRNDRKALENRITAIKDNAKDRETGTGGPDTPFGVQLGALDKTRYDVWQQFAGNILPGGAGSPAGAIPGGPLGGTGSSALPGGGSMAAPVTTPSFYRSAASGGMPGAASAGAAPGGAAAGGGNTTVKQVINISEPPPDPHSFSKQLGWEAAAMLG